MKDSSFVDKPDAHRILSSESDAGYTEGGDLAAGTALPPAHDSTQSGASDTIAGSDVGTVPDVLKRGSRRDPNHIPT